VKLDRTSSRIPVMQWIGTIGMVWGGVGVFGLLGFAIYRLAPRAVAAYEMGLTPGQWAITVGFCVFMAYSEGYRGFQQKFSPRTAARIRYLRDHPSLVRSLLGPLFSIGLFHATRRTKLLAWILTVGIVLLVLLVHRLDQPWRGIIDAGVVLGLSWGVLSLAWCIFRVLGRRGADYSPEVPNPGVS
jgi:hypothetical protein